MTGTTAPTLTSRSPAIARPADHPRQGSRGGRSGFAANSQVQRAASSPSRSFALLAQSWGDKEVTTEISPTEQIDHPYP